MAIVGTALTFGGAGCDWPWPVDGDRTTAPPETLIQTPQATIAGVGVEFDDAPAEPLAVTAAGWEVELVGPAPQPATREGCVQRWNAGNGAEELRRVPPSAAPTGDVLVRIDVALDGSDRCTVSAFAVLDGRSNGTELFVEAAAGRFAWGGGTSLIGIPPNATLSTDGSLSLR